MIRGIGTDIVEIHRIKKAIERSEHFKKRVFTEKEIEKVELKKDPFPSYAGRFAGKEAISKAIGTGVRGFNLVDIEILNDELGKPIVVLYGSLKEKLENSKVELSISHSKEYATAFAVIVD